jgi:hypothetical protein
MQLVTVVEMGAGICAFGTFVVDPWLGWRHRRREREPRSEDTATLPRPAR